MDNLIGAVGMKPEIVMVVAAARNNVIGLDGQMPWHLPADLKRFKRITIGKPVIMGRKTFESIGKPLPGRHNIVLTRSTDWQADGVTVVANLAEAIAAAGLRSETRAEQIMIIGGAEIYREARPIATRIELTRIETEPEGDAFFPAPEADYWELVAQEEHPKEGEAPAHSFLSYVRKPL